MFVMKYVMVLILLKFKSSEKKGTEILKIVWFLRKLKPTLKDLELEKVY